MVCLAEIHDLSPFQFQILPLQNVTKVHVVGSGGYSMWEGEYLCLFPTFTPRVCRLLHSVVSLLYGPLARFSFPPSVLACPPSWPSLSPVPAAHWSHGCVPRGAAGTTSGTETMTLPAVMACLERCPSIPLRGEERNQKWRRPSQCILLFIPFRGQGKKKSERMGNYTVI